MLDPPDLLDLVLFNNPDSTSEEELLKDLLAQDSLVDLAAQEELDVHQLAQESDKPLPAQDSIDSPVEQVELVKPQPAQDLLVDSAVVVQEELVKPQPVQDSLVDSVVLAKLHQAHKAQDSVDLVEVFQEAQPLLKAPDLVSPVEHLPDLLDLASRSAHLVVLRALASVHLEDAALLPSVKD